MYKDGRPGLIIDRVKPTAANRDLLYIRGRAHLLPAHERKTVGPHLVPDVRLLPTLVPAALCNSRILFPLQRRGPRVLNPQVFTHLSTH